MTMARSQGRNRRLSSFLPRAIAFVAIFHYSSLVFLYHGLVPDGGKDLLLYAQTVVINQPTGNSRNIIPAILEEQEPTIRILWAIESKSTDEERQRRQLLRETYLTSSYNKNPNSRAATSISTPGLFCSLSDLESGKTNVTDNCQFFYVFVVREDIKVVSDESDVLSFNQTLGLRGWLDYSWTVSKQHELTVMAWVQPDVQAFPLELIDFLKPRMGSAFFVETPKTVMKPKCRGCAWDQEAGRRNGRLFLVSPMLLPNILQDKTRCNYNPTHDLHQMMTICVHQSSDTSNTSYLPMELHTIGHQYTQPNLNQYQADWKLHLQMAHDYQNFERKHAIRYISGKFHRDPHRFTDQFTDLKTAMINWGLHPDQIHLYDGNFPDFIVQDPRWEQHLEFMQDPELKDLGAGYWFWKAALLEHHMNLASDGDFVIFGNIEFWNNLPWLMELLETMISRQANFAAYHNFFPENEWSKRELYELLCSHLPERFMPHDRSNQYTGHFFVLRKSPGAMDFMRQYVRLSANYHLLNDEPSVLADNPEFKEHRRDQSILSLLLKCRYGDSGKQVFSHPLIKDLGWFDAFTFHLNPLPA
jgi:hypothetical protein